jgi:hypothetical protein
MSSTESGNGASGESDTFEELLSYLRDPHRAQTASTWAEVAQSALGPEERAMAERMSPAVHRYLSRETDRETFERELASLSVPTVTNIPPVPEPLPETPPPPGLA